MFTIGVDFGTNSVRALVVRSSDGAEYGSRVVDYPSGAQGVLLDPMDGHLARQHPGVRTERLTLLTFVNMGVLAGLAGLIVAARLNSATPSAGNSFELDVIAACFIGGVSASGGVGKVMGVVIGAFFMGVMNNGMSILGIGIFWQQVVKGLVLLAAVYVDVYQKNKG